MSGGGGSKTQTTTTSSAPWVGVQPYLTSAYGQYQDYINNPSSTAARSNAIDTLNGFADNREYNTATNTLRDMAANPNSATYDQNVAGLNALGQTGALNAQGTAAQGTLSSIASGSNLDADAQSYLKSVVGGDYLTQNNPYFQDMVNNSIATARPSVDAAFASSGRLGSGSHAAAFADSANRAATSLGYQDYQNERNIQNSAAGLLNSGALQNASTQAGAATGLLNSQRQDAATRMNAMTGALSADQTSAARQLQTAQQLLSSSTIPGEQYTQAANLEASNSPEQRLATYIQLLNGAQGGTTSQQVPVSSGSGLLTGLGSVAGLAGGLGALGRGASGLTSLATSLGGWLSDARAKENIRPVGLLHNGQTVYAYNYKDGSPTHIGLLAQEVARDRPEAVGNFGNTGLLSVNYDAATA